MNRNLDLARALLLHIEGKYDGYQALLLDYSDLPDYKPEAVYYHLKMLTDLGFLKVQNQCSPTMPSTNGLTWAGHDFVDAIRDDAIWRKTKEGMKAAGGFSLRLAGRVATGFLEKAIEEKTGVRISL